MMYRREEVWTMTWTEQVIADGVVDDDSQILNLDGAAEIYAQWNTVGATTGAPDFDFHLEASDDKSTFTTDHWTTLKSAVAKNVIDAAPVEAKGSPRYARAELDVNTANLAAGESVTLIIRARWY